MTVTQIRPNGVKSTSGASVTIGGGAANAQTAVSDGLTSTYITIPSDYAWILFTLPSVALSSNQRVRSCAIEITNERDGAGGTTQDTHVALQTSSTGANKAADYISTRGLVTINTFDGPLAFADPNGGAWDDDVTAGHVQLWCQWLPTRFGADTPKQRVMELVCDVDINTQPVVSAVTVTNFTNNALPTVSWTWTDADSDIQTRYRVKIFDAATIAMGNFSPDTSTPVWDSGNVSDGGLTTQVATALQNGVTYTAYVKAAQDWPGPQGNLWWSAWASSATFTVTFSLPFAPIINSAAVLSDGNQFRTMLNVTVPVNLLSADNSSFETTVGQWAAVSNGATPTRSTAQAADGSASMQMSSSASGNMEYRVTPDANGQPRVDGNKTYTAIAQFRASTVARSVQVGIEWLDVTGLTIGSITFGTSVTDSTSNFNTQAVYTAVAPANAWRGLVHAKVLATGGAAEVHYLDKVSIHAGSSTTWMPGGYTSDQGGLVIERGEYLDDARGAALNWLHPQVASAGSTLQSAAFGFGWDTTNTEVTWEWLDQLIDGATGGYGNTPAGKLDWHTSTSTTPSFTIGQWLYGGTAYMSPCVQGQSHVFSCWAWVDTGTATVIPRIDWRDATGTLISSTTGATYTLTTTPQLILVTGSPAAGAVLATFAVQNNGSVSRHFYFTRFGFGLGTIPVDGKTPMGLATGVSASGTPLGLAWTEIRSTATNAAVTTLVGTTTGNVVSYPDYEIPPGRPVLYRAWIAYSFAGNVIRSALSNEFVVYQTPPAVSLMRSVFDPTLQYAVTRRTDASFNQSDDATSFHPMGADGNPVQVRDWLGGEDGSLQVITTINDGLQRLRGFVKSGTVVVIQWASGGRTYANLLDCQIDETISKDKSFVAVTIPYQETGMP